MPHVDGGLLLAGQRIMAVEENCPWCPVARMCVVVGEHFLACLVMSVANPGIVMDRLVLGQSQTNVLVLLLSAKLPM